MQRNYQAGAIMQNYPKDLDITNIEGTTGKIPFGGPVYQILKRLEEVDNGSDYFVEIVLAETDEHITIKLSQLFSNPTLDSDQKG
jgi:hypothetical protein